ncbi:hypothetical protein PJI17_32570, partial [Mycobacterium kansasii]
AKVGPTTPQRKNWVGCYCVKHSHEVRKLFTAIGTYKTERENGRGLQGRCVQPLRRIWKPVSILFFLFFLFLFISFLSCFS